MDLSILKFDEETKTVEINTKSNTETIEALQYLIDNDYIGASDFHRAYFTNKTHDGPITEITCDYLAKNYKKIIIHSIDLNKTDPEYDDFFDATCAIIILKMLHLYMFDMIEEILKDRDSYIFRNQYAVLVDKSGLFRWETLYGAQFIYD